MRVLVTGGRHFGVVPKERWFIYRCLDDILPRTDEDEYGNWLPLGFIITGGARGVDTVAIDYACCNWMQFKEYPVKDEDWKRLGHAAGPLRNREMFYDSRPELVVAFPGNRGTANMISIANAAGVPVRIFTYR